LVLMTYSVVIAEEPRFDWDPSVVLARFLDLVIKFSVLVIMH
jgi:hypothetical protein